MPRLTHGNHKATHALQGASAVADLLYTMRMESNASGHQICEVEDLVVALRKSGARNVTIEVTGEAPNALSPLHQHAAADRSWGDL